MNYQEIRAFGVEHGLKNWKKVDGGILFWGFYDPDKSEKKNMDCSFCGDEIKQYLSFCKTEHAFKDAIRSLPLSTVIEWQKIINKRMER